MVMMVDENGSLRLSSRVLWCSISFGLFCWALVELSGRGSSSLFAGTLCALFGLSLAKFSELQEQNTQDQQNPLPLPPPPTTPTAYCSICMESKPLYNTFTVLPCFHTFCNTCVGLYNTFTVLPCFHTFCNTCVGLYMASWASEHSAPAIRCPVPGCRDGVLNPVPCRSIVSPEVEHRCSPATCQAPQQDGDGEVQCRRRVPWYRRLLLKLKGKGKADSVLAEMAKKQKWQRCPNCRFYVDKNGGCNFITCRCGLTFCYLCGKETCDRYSGTNCRS